MAVPTRGGALWLTIGGLTPPAWRALEAAIRAQGATPALLDLHAAASVGVANGGCLYGTFAEDAIDGEADEPGDVNEMTVRFEEVVT